MSDQIIVIKKNIRASVEKVFEAWTQPSLMEKWFAPSIAMKITAQNTAQKHGAYTLTMQDAEGTYVHQGEYKVFEPPHKLVFTWNSPMVKNSQVSIALKANGDTTDLTLTHEFFPSEEIRMKHEGGWAGCLGNLQSFFQE